MECPVCNERNTGKVGSRQYYCWQCLIEFKITSDHQYRLYYVDSDGSLVEMKESELQEYMELS